MARLGKPLPPAKDIPTPTDEEIKAAIKRWNQFCPPEFIGLLKSDPVGTENSKARFLFDAERLVYIHRRTGREIPKDEINQAFIYFQKRTAEK